jgi:chromosome segregation ATPase
MDRTELLDVLTSNGLKPDSANKLIESVKTHLGKEKAKLEETYQRRTAQAKQVVLSEMARYKAVLSKRLGLFLEANRRNIEGQVRQQSGLSESRAVAELTEMKRILGGVPTKDAEVQKKIATLEEQARAANAKSVQLQEQYNQLAKTARTAVVTAKTLEKQLAESKAEAAKNKKLLESATPGRRTPAAGRKAEAVTGSAVLNEENVKHPAKPKPEPTGPG